MKVKVIGKKSVDFVNEKTNDLIKGINLYIIGPAEHVIGLMSDKIWIDVKKQKLYDLALSLNVSEQFIDVELIYEGQMGSRNLNLVDIKVLGPAK